MKLFPTITLVLLASTVIIGCQPNDPGQGGEGRQVSQESAFFSERPEKPIGSIMTIVRLQHPALLKSAIVVNGKVKLDPKAIEAVEAEQKEAISKLMQISPEAKILFKYRLSLNAIAVSVPAKYTGAISALNIVRQVAEDEPFERPALADIVIPTLSTSELQKRNSTTFIGAHTVRKTLLSDGQPIDGRGIKVGIIDTGIDYTHSMLGGSGKVSDFKSIDPNKANSHFPNKKVVGGIDLAGSGFNTGSPKPEGRIPQPDANPIDKAGHGTHVAGTVAGIGDGINTYDGVAPGADLYAIKVFGDTGSTGDTVVIAALEWALDPNQDLNLEDRMDVVNLSLGSGFGKPHLMYSVAIRNFVRSGSVIVASAGNSGDIDNIVGAPSTASEAISVAASIDYMDHNWRFSAVEIDLKKKGIQIEELVQGQISTPVDKFPGLVGLLVPAGIGDKPLEADLAAKVKGNIALMDRGKVSFVEKLKVAQMAGAIGVVMVNNKPGPPITMGGEVKVPFAFPAIMITTIMGDLIKSEIAAGEAVTVLFNSNHEIEKKELIDTITGFSSKGPRSLDSLIKPEITAPGAQITSAAVGQGTKSVRMGGTSMSGPHIAGAMALLRQYHPTLTQLELKSLIMTSASVMKDKDGVRYPISRQGAGRAQLFKAATSSIVVSQPALSLGEVMVDHRKVIQKIVQIKSLVAVPLELTFEADMAEGLELLPVEGVTLPPEGVVTVRLRFKISSNSKSKSPYIELDGFVNIKSGNAKIAHMPALAVINQISRVKSDLLSVFASSEDDAAEALVELTLTNQARNRGEALIFNQLGQDDRKGKWKDEDEHLSRSCDLQNAGYRIIEKRGEKYLQVGIKLYNSVTQWQHCEVSLQIDGNLDGNADQELVGLAMQNVAGLSGGQYASILLNAPKAKALRAKYDLARESGKPEGLSFAEAVEGAWAYRVYRHSSVAVMEASLSKLARTDSGELAIKLAVVSSEGNNVETDDFLSGHLDSWVNIQVASGSQVFFGMPEAVMVGAKSTEQVSMSRGEGSGSMLVLYPQNKSVKRGTSKDAQSEVVVEQYLF